MALLTRLLLFLIAWIFLRRAVRWGLQRMGQKQVPPRRQPDQPPRGATAYDDSRVEDAEYEELP